MQWYGGGGDPPPASAHRGLTVADLMLSRWAKLYSQPTKAEMALEPAIAALGVPYRFQHPIWALRVFPDFALPTLKLIIEVDDPSHNTKTKRAKDAERTAKLQARGWKVVRCTNEQAINDPRGTVARLLEAAGLDPKNLCKE
jgi:very-short-patch-repair endonuclease